MSPRLRIARFAMASRIAKDDSGLASFGFGHVGSVWGREGQWAALPAARVSPSATGVVGMLRWIDFACVAGASEPTYPPYPPFFFLLPYLSSYRVRGVRGA